jgi:hypothetical protein
MMHWPIEITKKDGPRIQHDAGRTGWITNALSAVHVGEIRISVERLLILILQHQLHCLSLSFAVVGLYILTLVHVSGGK